MRKDVKGTVSSKQRLMPKLTTVSVFFTSDARGETLSLADDNYMITVPFEAVEKIIEEERRRGNERDSC